MVEVGSTYFDMFVKRVVKVEHADMHDPATIMAVIGVLWANGYMDVSGASDVVTRVIGVKVDGAVG